MKPTMCWGYAQRNAVVLSTGGAYGLMQALCNNQPAEGLTYPELMHVVEEALRGQCSLPACLLPQQLTADVDRQVVPGVPLDPLTTRNTD
jgi:hypothetical protein